MSEINKQSLELRQKLGLSENASTDEVFGRLRQEHNLPDDAPDSVVIKKMLYGILDDLVEINDQLNQVQAEKEKLNPRKLLGKIATLFSNKK